MFVGDDFTGRPAKAKTDTLDADGEGDGEKPVKTTDGKGLSKTAQKILRVQKQPPAPTLFLGNLGFETTEVSILELFKAHRYWGRKEQAEVHEADEDEDIKAKSESKPKPKDVWVRKIRMGTFEDSGACKGSVSHISPLKTLLTNDCLASLSVCNMNGWKPGLLLLTLQQSSTLPRHLSTRETIA